MSPSDCLFKESWVDSMFLNAIFKREAASMPYKNVGQQTVLHRCDFMSVGRPG